MARLAQRPILERTRSAARKLLDEVEEIESLIYKDWIESKLRKQTKSERGRN